MFLFHVAFSLGLISLVMGTALYVWAANPPDMRGRGFAKLIGVLVILFALLSTLCTGYMGVRVWQGFHGPMPMMQRMQMPKPMMDQQTDKSMDQQTNKPMDQQTDKPMMEQQMDQQQNTPAQ